MWRADRCAGSKGTHWPSVLPQKTPSKPTRHRTARDPLRDLVTRPARPLARFAGSVAWRCRQNGPRAGRATGGPASSAKEGGFWWAVRDSNPRPSPCKGDALPTELTARPATVTAWRRCGARGSVSDRRQGSTSRAASAGAKPTLSTGSGPNRTVPVEPAARTARVPASTEQISGTGTCAAIRRASPARPAPPRMTRSAPDAAQARQASARVARAASGSRAMAPPLGATVWSAARASDRPRAATNSPRWPSCRALRRSISTMPSGKAG